MVILMQVKEPIPRQELVDLIHKAFDEVSADGLERVSDPQDPELLEETPHNPVARFNYRNEDGRVCYRKLDIEDKALRTQLDQIGMRADSALTFNYFICEFGSHLYGSTESQISEQIAGYLLDHSDRIERAAITTQYYNRVTLHNVASSDEIREAGRVMEDMDEETFEGFLREFQFAVEWYNHGFSTAYGFTANAAKTQRSIWKNLAAGDQSDLIAKGKKAEEDHDKGFEHSMYYTEMRHKLIASPLYRIAIGEINKRYNSEFPSDWPLQSTAQEVHDRIKTILMCNYEPDKEPEIPTKQEVKNKFEDLGLKCRFIEQRDLIGAFLHHYKPASEKPK